MKTILRFAGGLLLCSALYTPAAHTYFNVVGSGTAPVTWATAPAAAIFYRPTGDYFFGSAAATAYSVSYANYRTVNAAPTVSAIGSDAIFTAAGLNNTALVPNQLAVIPYSGDATSPTIAAVANASTSTIRFITKTNNTVVSSSALLDVAGAAVPATASAPGIRAMTASNDLGANGTDIVFAAVMPNTAAATDNWGAAAGGTTTGARSSAGLQAVLVGRNTTNGAPTFIATNLNTGGTAGNATPVDFTYTGSLAIADVADGVSIGITLASTTTGGLAPALWYDSILNRLYVGITGAQAAAGGATRKNGLITVGIFPVTKVAGTSISVSGGAQSAGPSGVNSPTQLAPFLGTYVSAGVPGLDNIGIIAGQAANGTATSGSARILRTMHTSTGFCYLIVNGGMATGNTPTTIAASVANLVYAVPLVGPTATTAAAVGTFADMRTGDYLTQATFTTAAVTSLCTTATRAACVGGGLTGSSNALPVSGVLNNITDMYVDGDAVYVAAGTTAPAYTATTGTNSPGIWKSQAIFDDLGKIDHWTDWQQVVPTDMGGAATNDGTDGRVTFAAVDGYTGHVWATQSTYTNVTQWSAPTTQTTQSGLAAAVNTALSNKCYSILDLNASVTAWGASTPARITLFGGQEKVCFAITGSGSTANATLDGAFNVGPKYYKELVDTVYDYTNSGTFVTTTLPSGAGAVISLGYSSWSSNATTTTGFLFAGTAGTATVAPGLYVYAATTGGTGFDSNAIQNDLRQAPFAGTFSWTRLANINGMPIKITSLGGGVHVLTRSATIDRVYTCPRVATAALLNSTFVVTASSGTTPGLSSATQIYDLVISVSPGLTAPAIPADGVEQLLILTSDGIYTTSSSIGMQAVANVTQTTAGWSRIAAPTTLGFFTDYISQPLYHRNPETFWFANFIANPNLSQSIFNRNIQYQMSRQAWLIGAISLTNAITYTEDPTNTATFNGATSFNQTTAPTIYKNFPIISRLFYDDGSRRFFIVKKTADDTRYSILVLPYNLYDYNITADGKAVMADTLIAAAGSFYWMSPIGALGRLAMSTENGICMLQ